MARAHGGRKPEATWKVSTRLLLASRVYGVKTVLEFIGGRRNARKIAPSIRRAYVDKSELPSFHSLSRILRGRYIGSRWIEREKSPDRVRKLVRISRGFQPRIGEGCLARHLSRRLKTVYQAGTSSRYTRRLLYILSGQCQVRHCGATPGINPRCSGS